MTNYKVFLISHEYPPFAIGGISSYCFSLAKALSQKKIQTIVFCGRSKKPQVSFENNYLQIVRFPCADVPPRYLWFQVQNFKVISKLIDRKCILHAVNPNSSAFLIFLKKKLKLPIVTTLHEHPLIALKEFATLPLSQWTMGDFMISAASYPLNISLTKVCLRTSDHIIVPGKYTKDYLKKVDAKTPQEKISVIYNGVNLEEIDRIEKLPRKDANELTIVSYGRLVSTKGFLHLVRIMPKLCKTFPNLSAQIIGKGPLEGKIRDLISRLALRERIRLVGFLPHSDLIARVKNSDIVVLPTFHEVGPFISALEGMACYKTVVVFNLPFTREFVKHMDNGILAKAHDIKDLFEKVSTALYDRKLRERIGRQARNYVEKYHNWSKLVNKYIEIYENLLIN